jgi:hypothetical protein
VLSPVDADLARRDPAIPGLTTVLDGDVFLAALAPLLPAVSLRSMRPSYARYKPMTRCTVGYCMETDQGELFAYASAHGPDAADKLQKARELQHMQGVCGPAAVVMENPAISVYLFPSDRRLKALRRLSSAEQTRQLLSNLFPRQAALHDATLQPLRYKPERRYVARLDTAEGAQAVLKCYTADGYAAAKAGAEAFTSRGVLQLLAPAGYSDRSHVLAFDWQTERPLPDILSDNGLTPSDKAAAVRLTGAALAELHAQPVGDLPPRSREAELRRLEAQAITLEHLCPALAEPARGLVRRIIGELQQTPPASAALHSDFYDQQVLIGEDAAMILDLDQTQGGDPAADLGLFIAHLERAALYDRLSAETVSIAADALLTGYQEAGGAADLPAMHLYTAIGLLYLAAEPFRYREPDWPERMTALVQLANNILERAGMFAHPSWRQSGSATAQA